MKILFLDTATPRPYSMVDDAPGGTEMTVVRVATGLAERGHSVTVAQRGRVDALQAFTKIDGPSVRYAPIRPMWIPEEVDALVVLRRPEAIAPAIQLCKPKKVILWCHDFNQDHVAGYAQQLVDTKTTVLCVSSHHEGVFQTALERTGLDVDFDAIYPPIDDGLAADSTPFSSFRLLFGCSPHKGLDRAILAFREIYRRDSRFELIVTNPGYYQTVAVNEPNVHVIGTLPNSKMIEEMRHALCMFHPNDVFPETFGIVHAEAHAVGVPVLAIRHGATGEVVQDSRELMDEFDPNLIADRVISWSNGNRPVVRGRDEFRLRNVLDRWEDVLRE